MDSTDYPHGYGQCFFYGAKDTKDRLIVTSSESRKQRKRLEKAAQKAANEDIILDFDFSPGGLIYDGPIITTALAVTGSHAEALNRAGLPVPEKVMCRFLVDTGADGCVVKHEFAERAGLKLIGSNIPIHGVGVDTTGKMYMGRIEFGVKSRLHEAIIHSVHVEVRILAGTLNGSTKIDGLIGRDVLSHFDMQYYGKLGKMRLKYHRPEK